LFKRLDNQKHYGPNLCPVCVKPIFLPPQKGEEETKKENKDIEK